jgi:hypothetical protein
MNFGRLRFVAERAELGERREVLMSVKVPEQPGRWVLRMCSRVELMRQLYQVPLFAGWSGGHRVHVPILHPFQSIHYLLVPPSIVPILGVRTVARSKSERGRRDLGVVEGERD